MGYSAAAKVSISPSTSNGHNGPHSSGHYRYEKITDEMVAPYIKLVNATVGRLARVLPSHINLDDLRAAGLSGLLEGLVKYDCSHPNANLNGYLSSKIRGAILDYVRQIDSRIRTARRDEKKMDEAVHALEVTLGRIPETDEVVRFIGVEKFLRIRELV